MEQKILIVIVIILFIYIIFNKEEENLGNVSVIENNKDNIVIQDGDTKKKVSKVCTHMGCIVNLNNNQLLCPCHGSIFDLDGKVVKGPARDNLEVTILNEKFTNCSKLKDLEW